MKYIEKLRNSGLRPTKQRLQICEVLFDTERTFHFTINDLANKINNLNLKLFDTVFIDCLTMWLTNHYLKDNDIFKESLKLISAIQRAQINLVIVTNEIGYSVVPENKMAREFQKIQGQLNQQIALEVQRVIQVVAGLPVVIKENVPQTEHEN